MRYTASALGGTELILNCRDKHEHDCFLLTAPISSVVIILEFRLKLDEL
jgi:hypothetical protein